MNSDKIIINSIRVFANHGVFDFEKQNGQEFMISCILKTDLRNAGKTDNLENTVNYAQVCELIESITKENCFDLLETLAEKICETILVQFYLVNSVEVTVLKTDAPIDIKHESIGISICRKRHRAYLSLGSNIGDSKKYLLDAIATLSKNKHTKVTKCSSFHITAPYGNVEQPNFLNACVEIETLLEPLELLEFTSSIENEAGRTREIHWGPRTLDIDIIFYDNDVVSENKLIIPHIEMHKRMFVLKPLCEIAPYAIHPLLNRRVIELLDFAECDI